MKHPIDEPDPCKSDVMRETASSLGLPIIDVKAPKPEMKMCAFYIPVVIFSFLFISFLIHLYKDITG